MNIITICAMDLTTGLLFYCFIIINILCEVISCLIGYVVVFRVGVVAIAPCRRYVLG